MKTFHAVFELYRKLFTTSNLKPLFIRILKLFVIDYI